MSPEAWLLVAAVGVLALTIGALIGRRVSPPESPQSPVPPAVVDRLAPADALGIGLLSIDDAGRIGAANDAAERLLGSRAGGLPGKSMMEAFIDHGVEEMAQRARRDGSASGDYTIGSEPQRTLTVRAWKEDGAELWVALNDVSELRRLQRIRTEFVDNLSHELRTPLTTVRLLTEALSIEAERTNLPPRVRESIGKIDVETGHLVQMVNELLDLARIEQGDAQLRHEPLEVGRVVTETVARLRTYAERQGVSLREEELGTAEERTISGDEEKLGQVFANLIHNAIKFSPSGAEVVVHVRPDFENVLVEVEDHGAGIARRDANRIFERFYKADRARSRGRGGTGLGLSIARHIVERHGGHIWVQSQEGVGSRFFVSLPRE